MVTRECPGRWAGENQSGNKPRIYKVTFIMNLTITEPKPGYWIAMHITITYQNPEVESYPNKQKLSGASV